MDNHFEIPVHYQSVAYDFPAELIPYGYSYTIEVDVFGTCIAFERDEEMQFRAVLPYDERHQQVDVDKGLLSAIADALGLLFNEQQQ